MGNDCWGPTPDEIADFYQRRMLDDKKRQEWRNEQFKILAPRALDLCPIAARDLADRLGLGHAGWLIQRLLEAGLASLDSNFVLQRVVR